MTDILLITALLMGLVNMYLLLRKVVWRSELEQTVADLLNQITDILKLKERAQRFISRLVANRDKT